MILNGARLLHIQRLLVVGQLALQLVNLGLGRLATLLPGVVLLLRLGSHFALFIQAVAQLLQVALVAFDLLLLAHRRLHQVKVIARRLVIGFQIGLGAVLLLQLTRHLHVTVLLAQQLLTPPQQLAA